MITWIGAQTTSSNRNIAGKKESKVTSGGIFSLKNFNIDFTVYAHKFALFQNGVMLFKMTARFPNIWGPRKTFWYQYHGKQNPKRPGCFGSS